MYGLVKQKVMRYCILELVGSDEVSKKVKLTPVSAMPCYAMPCVLLPTFRYNCLLRIVFVLA